MDFSVEAGARREFRSLALGGGALYQQIQAHFKNVRARLDHLTQIHSKHRDALQQAFAQVRQGNHLSAANLLAAADLKQQSADGFSDLDYTTVTANIASQFRVEDEMVSFAKDLPLACAKILDDFKVSYDTGNISSNHDQAKSQLANLRRAFEQHWVKVATLPGSELEKNCRPTLEAIQPDLGKTETELGTIAVAGARSQRRFLITAAILSIAVLIALAYGISVSRKRAETEAMALTEAKATAERVATAEAKAAAKRRLADTKIETERVAAEARAAIERAAAETAEQQQRIAEAEANLAKNKLEFRKPEVDFREARMAKEEILADIVGQITTTEKELDTAEHDSAEQYYGPKLIHLLSSFTGDETFSGNEKHPKTTDAIRILDHAPKSQVSRNSTGYEDISNVKGFYFVSDFAFRNIPERDHYSWSERSKIDKLIGEYLTVGADHNARRQASIDLLQETLQNKKAAADKVRAELRSIAIAESEARGPINRAQEQVDALRIRSTFNK